MTTDAAGSSLVRPILVGTGLQLALVIAGHYSPAVAQLFPIAGTSIGGLAGLLASSGTPQGAGTAAKNGALAGGLGGLTGTIVSYLLSDIPMATIGIGTGASALAGALGSTPASLLSGEDDAGLESHIVILENFRDAILNGTPILAPAEEAIRSLEMGNAMLLSGLLGRSVELPIDAALMEREIKRLASR